MRLIRSWPDRIPEGRNYVVDAIERLVISGCDYKALDTIDDDVLLIEWDIAIGADELATFMRRCADEPRRVRVAPYRLYPASTRADWSVWAHRVRDTGKLRWARHGDPICHQFGFGLIYMPRSLVRGFTESLRPSRERFSDVTFSVWHERHAPVREVPIDWDCPTVHLHYALPLTPGMVP